MFLSLKGVFGKAQRRKLAFDGVDFALHGLGTLGGEPIGLEQGDGHAPDQTELEFRIGFELAQHALEGANIRASVVRGQEEKEGRQVFFVQV